MKTDDAKAIVQPLIQEFTQQHFEVLIASVCTEDGFVLAHQNGRSADLEDDKIAALSSTLLSLAEAAAKVIKCGELKVNIIEAKKANIVVVKSRYRDLPIVVTVAANASLSIGQVLFIANRLSNRISGS